MNESTLTSWATDEWPAYEPDEILPGLFQGGTHDHEVIGFPTPVGHYDRMSHQVDPANHVFPFDLVVTLYADAQPAPWGVQETRFGFPDGSLQSRDIDRVVAIARDTHRHWQAGDNVLIRCQAGVNRSGLITALILIIEGIEPAEAIELIRTKRSSVVLSNAHFENWLLKHATDQLATSN